MEYTERLNLLAEKFYACHPRYDKSGCYKYAEKILAELSHELEEVLDKWLLTGEEIDYVHGKYSVSLIMDLRSMCYIDALELLNYYVKDPIDGEIKILPY